MKEYEEKEILRYLTDNIPIIFDVEKKDLKYDTRNINYKIYKYIRELQEEVKQLRKR